MVREPRLLFRYVEELGLSIDELCRTPRSNAIPCPPSPEHEFRLRFIVTAYVYLKVLKYELFMDPSINVIGLRELMGDIMADMVIYKAPQTILEEVRGLAREILRH